jgi:hypothetical protein
MTALWLHGPAGSGKSQLARALCERLNAAGHLGGSFFANVYDNACGSSKAVVRTLACQLCNSHPGYTSSIAEVLGNTPDILALPMYEQVNKLLAHPLERYSAAYNLNSMNPLVFVIDGLDQLDVNRKPPSDTDVVDQTDGLYHESLPEVLQMVEHLASLLARFNVKLLVTSRSDSRPEHMEFALSRLQSIPLEDMLLTQGLQQALRAARRDAQNERATVQFMVRILGVMSVLQETPSVSMLHALVNHDASDDMMQYVTTHLSAIITVQRLTLDRHVMVLYRSMAAYLQDTTRCCDARFSVDPLLMHAFVASRCMEIIIRDLPQDDGLTRTVLSRQPTLAYACRHWAVHLASTSDKAITDPDLMDHLRALTLSPGRMDAWVSSMSILCSNAEGITILQMLLGWIHDGAHHDQVRRAAQREMHKVGLHENHALGQSIDGAVDALRHHRNAAIISTERNGGEIYLTHDVSQLLTLLDSSPEHRARVLGLEEERASVMVEILQDVRDGIVPPHMHADRGW